MKSSTGHRNLVKLSFEMLQSHILTSDPPPPLTPLMYVIGVLVYPGKKKRRGEWEKNAGVDLNNGSGNAGKAVYRATSHLPILSLLFISHPSLPSPLHSPHHPFSLSLPLTSPYLPSPPLPPTIPFPSPLYVQ